MLWFAIVLFVLFPGRVSVSREPQWSLGLEPWWLPFVQARLKARTPAEAPADAK